MQNKNRTSYRKQEGLHELCKENSKRVNLRKEKSCPPLFHKTLAKEHSFTDT